MYETITPTCSQQLRHDNEHELVCLIMGLTCVKLEINV